MLEQVSSIFYEYGFTTEQNTGSVYWTTHVNGSATNATGLEQATQVKNDNYNPRLTYTDKMKDLNLQNYQGHGTDDILEKVHSKKYILASPSLGYAHG